MGYRSLLTITARGETYIITFKKLKIIPTTKDLLLVSSSVNIVTRTTKPKKKALLMRSS